MSVIGVLEVDLIANTAKFSGDLGKATQDAEKFGKSAQGAGEAMDSSMGSSVGAVRLLSHELGVPLPRELSRLVASLPGVGAAFAAMLPVVGVVAAVAVIGSLVEKHEEAAAAMRKHATEMENLTTKEREASNTMDIANLKLDDQIAKLEGRPNTNRIKEALLETANAADHFSSEMASDFTTVDEAIEKDTGFWGRMKSSALDALDAILTATDGESDAEHAAFEQALNGDKNMIAAKKQLLAAQEAVNAATKLPDSTEDEQIKKQQAMGDALRNRAAAETQVGKAGGPNNQDLAAKMDEAAAKDVERANRTAKEIISIQRHVKLAQLQDAAEAETQQDAIDADFVDKWIARTKSKDKWRADAARKDKDIADAHAQAAEEQADLDRQLAQSGQTEINSLIASKQKETDEWIKASEKMQAEDKRHADTMADLEGRNDPRSKSAENKAYADKLAAWQQDRALLAQKPLELKKVDDKMLEETQKHNNRMRELNRQYFGQFNAEMAHSVAGVLTGQETIGQATRQMFLSMTTSMIEHFVEKKLMQLEDMIFTTTANKTEQTAAATLAGANMVASWAAAPWPIDAAAPSMGATAFSAAMAFETGGEVPGMGNGDTVPAMLTPGETVVTKQLTEQVKNSTGSGKSTSVHVHVNAVDASGFEGLIMKHSGMLQKHISAAVRKANR